MKRNQGYSLSLFLYIVNVVHILSTREKLALIEVPYNDLNGQYFIVSIISCDLEIDILYFKLSIAEYHTLYN